MSQLAEKIKEHAVFMAGAKSIKMDYSAQLAEDKLIQTEWRHHVFMIAKEMINNAVKYSDAETVVVKLSFEKNIFNLEVKDNGIGFDMQAVTRGNGLDNLQQRAAELNSDLIINAAKGEGTSITLISKITQ